MSKTKVEMLKMQLAAAVGAGFLSLIITPAALAQTEGAAPAQQSQMYSEQQQKNLQIIETALDNARAGKLDLAKPYFADDFVLTVAEGLPYGGVYKGWDGYAQVLEKLKAFWVSTKHVDREFVPLGDDRVFVHFTLNANIKKNNAFVDMPVVAIWTMKDDKIASIINFYFDTKRIAELAAQ